METLADLGHEAKGGPITHAFPFFGRAATAGITRTRNDVDGATQTVILTFPKLPFDRRARIH